MNLGVSAMLSARSSLGPRGLDGGSIAGAVVGSVVGTLLIILCVVPFVLRARRTSRDRHGDAASHPELGDASSPGGRSSSRPHISESKRLSADLLVPGPLSPDSHQPGLVNGEAPKLTNGHSPHLPSLTYPSVANPHQGPPSPASPLSPTSRPSFPPVQGQTTSYAQAYPTPPAEEHPPHKTHHPSVGTVGKDGSVRELSRTDSSTRDLSGITAQGITDEPETFETSSTSPSHRHFPHHILGSLRKLTDRRHSDHRRDSRRSTTDGARSPSISTTEALSQQDSAQLSFVQEADINAPGEAWSYYNDPTLPAGSNAPVTAGPAAFAPLSLVPPAHGQAPLSPVSLPDQTSHRDSAPQPILTKPVVEEPDLISPDSDKTVTPLRALGKQNSLLRGPGSLTRTDSLPPLQPIVADIETAQIPFSASPSGRPMDMMRPTNEAESAWRVHQEILKIESPPAELPLTYMEPFDDSTTYAKVPYNEAAYNEANYNETPYIKSNPSPESDYQSPPEIILTGNNDFSAVDFSMIVDVDAADEQMVHYSYFTPPPSSGPSNQNTPDTRISDYTASPSPRSDMGPGSGGQTDSSPRLFPCDQCHRVFDQVHKLKYVYPLSVGLYDD